MNTIADLILRLQRERDAAREIAQSHRDPYYSGMAVAFNAALKWARLVRKSQDRHHEPQT